MKAKLRAVAVVSSSPASLLRISQQRGGFAGTAERPLSR